VYVPDAGRAVAAALDVPAGIYNVVDDEPVRFVEYVQALVRAAGAPKPIHLPGFVGRLSFGEVWNYFTRSQRVSNAKLKRSSTWKPAVPNARDGWVVVVSELDKRSEPAYAAAH
jgi:nucleoside-diphosphate-sugar epimerase